MRAAWPLMSLLGLAGCLEAPPDGPRGDGGTVPWDCETWSPRHVDPCELPAPADLSLRAGEWTYDTGSGELSDPDGAISAPPSALFSQPGAGSLRALSTGAFEVDSGARLRVVGPHPLLVAAFASIAVAGTIDVASRRGETPGAGADDPACDLAGAGSRNQDAGGGGGGFGALGGSGGSGGLGEPGAGGDPVAPPPTVLMGGCAGGAGGGGSGLPGDGGGALELAAAVSIAVSGVLDAGGAGGRSATGDNGGGGGGSGGYLGLDSPAVQLADTAVVAANGGGGGTGCDGGTGTDGTDGIAGAGSAGGGSGGCNMAADGGDGGALALEGGGTGASSSQSGGGGGGAAGFVLVFSTGLDNRAMVVSPAPISP